VAGPVLVADDEPLVRELTVTCFEDVLAGHPIVAVPDGDAAMAVLERAVAGEEAVPVLLVLDEHMPGRTGREILRWRNTQPELSKVPVIMLTAEAIGSDIDVVLDARFVRKPVSCDELQQIVTELGIAAEA
jgi:CheY-like chemotaxis protein